MKAMKLLLATTLIFSSVLAFAGSTENKKYAIEELSTSQEMELLSDYVCKDVKELKDVKIEIYDANFELVENGEISLEKENAHLEFMISQSHLLIDNGHLRIYQVD